MEKQNQNLLSTSENTIPRELVSCITVLRITALDLYVTIHTEKWAMAFRHFEHKNTDTNMYVERYVMCCAFQTTYMYTRLVVIVIVINY